MKSIAIIGAGTLGKIIAEGVCSGAAGAWKLLGLTDCDEAGGRASAQKYRCAFYVDVPSLLAARPDVVIEAATAAVLKQWAGTILEHGVDMIALSAGALADDSFKELVEKACRASGAKLHIPSGAVGGFDLLSAARFAGDYSLVIRNLKPRRASKAHRGWRERNSAPRKSSWSFAARRLRPSLLSRRM